MSRRIFLCGITSSGNLENLKALIDPVAEFFHGLIWTFHLPKDDGSGYLESCKGEGEIVYAKFCQRHGYSMTHYLWQGPMVPGDFFVQVDTLERLGKNFCGERLPGLIELMNEAELGMVANFGKGLVFRYSEDLEFRGSPHWYPINIHGKMVNMELPKDEFWHVRDSQRDEYQFVTHYGKYYLYPAGSNHCLLGLEKNGDPNKLFPIREERRLRFREELRKRDVALTTDGLKEILPVLDEELKSFFREEKILNDFYRFFHLNRRDFKDDHDHKNLVAIP